MKLSRVLHIAALIFLFATPGRAQSNLTRVLVHKNPAPDRPVGSPLSPFSPINATLPLGAGFSQIADYAARTLYEGPEAAASGLLDVLKTAGYHAEVTTDMDAILFNDLVINADTGIPFPPIPLWNPPRGGRDPLYLLGLRGYPTPEWLADMTSRGIRLIEALPPAGYLVRGAPGLVENLKTRVSYVRGVFPVTPAMKKVLFRPGMTPVDLPVAIQAVEEVPEESLSAHLAALDANAAEEKVNGRARYRAALSEVDIATLTHFDTVYSISPIGEPQRSDERQASLVLKPTINAGRLELPTTAPGYQALLASKGISNFSNTVIGLIDSGLDNMPQGGTLVHPDFPGGTVQCTGVFGEFTCQDQTTHGTLVGSIITGAPPGPPGAMREDCLGCASSCGGYRWGLGLAPGATLKVRGTFGCSGPYEGTAALLNAINSLVTHSVNVVNYSYNDAHPVGPESQPECGYNYSSQLLDRRTRQNGILFTVSGGNVVSGCPYVRAPATAKNVVAAGATRSFTPGWNPDTFGGADTCPWADPLDGTPLDGRNIPSFSPQRASSAYNLFKPDLVAPAVRVTGPLTRTDPCLGGGTVFCNRAAATYLEAGFPANLTIPAGLHYGYSAGTSFAAPAVAGAAAVLRKWYANLTGNLNPSPALTKAMLINGARDIAGGTVYNRDNGAAGSVQYITHDPYQGWGMLNLERQILLAPANNYYFFDQAKTLTPTDTFWEKLLTVRDGAKPIRVTLVWTDAPGGLQSTYSVKNDLTLLAYQTACFPCWYGNNISNSNGMSTTTATRDSRNNVEEIIIPANTFVTGAAIRVYVVADSLRADGLNPDGMVLQQDFAVAVENAY